MDDTGIYSLTKKDGNQSDWPLVDSYADEKGITIKVYKAAYATALSNKFTARPKKVGNIIRI